MYYGSEGTAFSPEDAGQGVPTEAIGIHKELLDTYEWFSSTLGELCGQLYFDSQGLETMFGPNPSAAERQWWETRYDSIDANWVLTIARLEKIKAELNDLFSPYEEGRFFDALAHPSPSRSISAKTPAPSVPTPTQYPRLASVWILNSRGEFTVDYPTDKWQLDDSTLSHRSIPGCTLTVFADPHGLPFEWETREYDVPVQLGEHQFLRRAWAVGSAAAPRFVGYRLDEPGKDVLFDILGSEALDNNPSDFAVCQQDAEAVIATLTID